MIKFENVSKKFGKLSVISNVSFTLDNGEFVFLTGQTGAGKTTIIRLLIKELQLDNGKITVDNWDFSQMTKKDLPSLRRHISVIFQDLKLLPDKTLFENVALSLEVRDTDPIEIKKRVKAMLKFVGLENKSNSFPQELSGGELQRAAIARAVVTNPKIILADEPTADLDPATTWQIIQLLSKFNKQKTTILFSTHNFDIVNSLKKRVITLKNGTIIKDEEQGKYQT